MHKDLAELKKSLTIVVSSDIGIEAHENMVSFTMDTLGDNEETIGSFLCDCKAVFEKTKPNVNMTFYCWLDELAGQLRVGIVSRGHAELPFRGNIRSLTLTAFCKSLTMGCSGVYSGQEKLNVWQTHI